LNSRPQNLTLSAAQNSQIAVAATLTAAARRFFSEQIGQGEIVMPFYDNGRVRIRYEEAGSGFPLLLVPGGGLNSTIAGLKRGVPFNAIEEFKGEYRCIFLRHAQRQRR
jgi:acyl CoA:acetate/3-ketoacid CoA transferase alpha subunit